MGFMHSGDSPIFFILMVISLAGSIAAYFLFVRKDNVFDGFLGGLHDFLTFNKLFVSGLLKFLYILAAVSTTLYSFVFMFSGVDGVFGIAISMLIFGNIIIRVMYEFMMMKLVICRNTSEISKRLTRKHRR